MIETAAELYVHATAIEEEAAERYAELAERMADLGNDEVASLFRVLAGFEAAHLAALKLRTQGVDLPALRCDYAWLDAGPPEAVAREFFFRLVTPRYALQIALHAEQRARAFFEHVYRSAQDPALRALAREMMADEIEHIAMVEAALARTPDSVIDWASVFEMPPGSTP